MILPFFSFFDILIEFLQQRYGRNVTLSWQNQSKIEEMNAGSVAETRPKMYAMTETESKLENHHIQIVLSDVGVSSSDGNNDKHPTTKSVSFFDRNEADVTKPAISTTDNGATEKRSSDVDDQERESKRQRL